MRPRREQPYKIAECGAPVAQRLGTAASTQKPRRLRLLSDAGGACETRVRRCGTERGRGGCAHKRRAPTFAEGGTQQIPIVSDERRDAREPAMKELTS